MKDHSITMVEESFQVGGDSVDISLWYPRISPIKFVRVDLTDVRASDGIRISYDYDRDGWVIEQPTINEWTANDKVMDEGWTEVAFVESWQLEDE